MQKRLNIVILILIFHAISLEGNSQVRSNVSRIVKEISKYETVDGNAVSISGIMTDQYRRFQFLTKNATQNELIHLTNHSSPKVRVYAFWSLAKRKYFNLVSILEKHLKDTTTFTYFSGCELSEEKVNSFFVDILTPNHIDEYCKKMTTQEILVYRRRVGSL